MAAVLRTPPLLFSPLAAAGRVTPFEAPRCFQCSSRRQMPPCAFKLKQSSLYNKLLLSRKFPLCAAYRDTTNAEETAGTVGKDSDEEISSADGSTDGGIIDTEEIITSTLLLSLQSYKEALANKDENKTAEIEAFLLSIEDEKNSLSIKFASLSEELSTERDRVLRISADFDNFRKRTERERLSLMANVQGEVIESLLPVLDNFERAKSQIKTETEGEVKINNSYQSICKQFLEILSSLDVEAVETIGSSFDPLLHEAIMREDSSEFEEGIVIQEFRKGFKLGERLLRPSMVKVSAGPGPDKEAADDDPVIVVNEDSEASESIEDDGDSE